MITYACEKNIKQLKGGTLSWLIFKRQQLSDVGL
jgi:hypothetical protein